MLFKIGDYSKLAQVSVKTLRYYGNIGLLKPAWVDHFTGYRYYSLEQLPRLNRILALKDLGFSLDQIQKLIQEDLSVEALRGMLRMKEVELERKLESEQFRLEQVKARITQLESEDHPLKYDVVIKSIPTHCVVGAREIIRDRSGVFPIAGQLCQRLETENALPENYNLITIYHDMEYFDHGIDTEVAIPLEGYLSGKDLKAYKIPGEKQMACVIYSGKLGNINEAHNALLTWVEYNNCQVIGPNRDVHLQAPTSVSSSYFEMPIITEVQYPIKKQSKKHVVSSIKENSEMEPKIVTKKGFKAIGYEFYGKNEGDVIERVWSKFLAKEDDIPNKVWRGGCVGFSWKEDKDGKIRYVAGHIVENDDDIPEGMTSYELPDQKYAVFTCKVPTLLDTYKYIYETWLPKTEEYDKGPEPEFEYYDAEYEDDTSPMYIYIPIKDKK